MRLSAPKQITWIIALALGILGILAALIGIQAIAGFSTWLVALGLAVLLVATATRSL